MGFVNILQRSLIKRPILTNTTIYACFYSAAEMSQQTFNKYYTKTEPSYEFANAARVIFSGTFVNAAPLTIWYRFLDTNFPGTSAKTIATKVFLDQFIVSPPLLAAFFVVIAIMERKDDLFEELRAKYLITLAANICYWLPILSLNFYYVPPYARVASIAAAEFIWINYICVVKRRDHSDNEP